MKKKQIKKVISANYNKEEARHDSKEKEEKERHEKMHRTELEQALSLNRKKVDKKKK